MVIFLQMMLRGCPTTLVYAHRHRRRLEMGRTAQNAKASKYESANFEQRHGLSTSGTAAGFWKFVEAENEVESLGDGRHGCGRLGIRDKLE